MSSPRVFRSSRTSPHSQSRTGSLPASVRKNTTSRIGRRRSCSWPAGAIREMYHHWYTGGKVDSGCRWPPDGERRDQPGRMKGEARRWGGVIANDGSIPVCHVLPAPATSALRRFLRHLFGGTPILSGKTTNRNHPTRGALAFLKVAASARPKPRGVASRSAAWSCRCAGATPCDLLRAESESDSESLLSRLQKRTLTGSQAP